MKGQFAGIGDTVKEYISGFIGVFIALTIAFSLVTPILAQVNNITGVPVLSGIVVGSVVGGGILLFMMKVFF
jgi:hypothetical protein